MIKLDVVGGDKYDLPPEGSDGYNEDAFNALLVLLNVAVVVVAVLSVAKQAVKRMREGGNVKSDDDEGDDGVSIEMPAVAVANPTSGAEIESEERPVRRRSEKRLATVEVNSERI